MKKIPFKNKGEVGYEEYPISANNINKLQDNVEDGIKNPTEDIVLPIGKMFKFANGCGVRATTDGHVIISGNGGSVFLRPLGDTNASNQIELTPKGKITVNGKYVNQFQGTPENFDLSLMQGEYLIANKDILNAPYSGAIYGKLIVTVSTNDTHNNKDNWIWQHFINNRGKEYKREKTNSEPWTSWKEVTPTTTNVDGLKYTINLPQNVVMWCTEVSSRVYNPGDNVIDINFPFKFANTSYFVVPQLQTGGGNFAGLVSTTIEKNPTSMRVDVYNSGGTTDPIILGIMVIGVKE